MDAPSPKLIKDWILDYLTLGKVWLSTFVVMKRTQVFLCLDTLKTSVISNYRYCWTSHLNHLMKNLKDLSKWRKFLV